jgi:hypothetical protein
VRNRPGAMQSAPGGILADEMGLGKTVEVLACLLLHRRPDLPDVTPLPVRRCCNNSTSQCNESVGRLSRSTVCCSHCLRPVAASIVKGTKAETNNFERLKGQVTAITELKSCVFVCVVILTDSTAIRLWSKL